MVFKGGEHAPEELANDGLVIATYTPEGAEKLAEVSEEFNNGPSTWIVNSPDEVVKSVSALGDINSRLDVGGSFEGSDRALSFGVRRRKAPEGALA